MNQHQLVNSNPSVSDLSLIKAGRESHETLRTKLDQSYGRLHSMVLAQIRPNGSQGSAQVDLVTCLLHLTEELLAGSGKKLSRIRVKTHGKTPVRTLASHAILFSLMMNELLDNTLTHAFPENRHGLISIGVERSHSGKVIGFCTDDGIGPPPGVDWHAQGGRGLRLVETLGRQLNASIDWTFEGGVGCRFSFEDPTL